MSLNGTVWSPIGPSPMSESGTQDNGLVTSITVDPNDSNVIYIGTAQGGVWRSADAGTTWTPLFDQALSMGIGEPGGVAIDPSNTDVIYVGTSGNDGSAEPDTVQQPPTGLYKSTDGGSSWVLLGFGYPAGNTGNANQFTQQQININVVIVDPANGVLYLGSSNGVYTSSDGGLNWAQANGINGNAWSLALDVSTPVNARVLHAGVAGIGVFLSKDGGSNFTQTLSATTAVVASVLAGGNFNRVVVALAPPTSPPHAGGVQVVYVTMSGGGSVPDPVGVFLSTNQGGTWTQRSGSGISGTTYGGYALDMTVDPQSPGDGAHDILYYGCQNQFKSTDSGNSFSGMSVGHVDTHTWATVVPSGGGSTVVYCGCDGGIHGSTDAGGSWNPLNGGGLQTGLFYNIAVKPDATASVTVGALQDNEVQTTAGASGLGWDATYGGDGWDVAYDGSSPPVLYSTSGGPSSVVAVSTNDGASYTSTVTPPWGATDTGGFLLTQIAADPGAAGTLYVTGSVNLWQLLGGTWRIIASPNTAGGNVDVAPSNGNNVVVAAGSEVLVTTNALASSGVTFANITRNLPGRNVSRAVFDPVDPTVIYAVMNGFDSGTGQNVFRTTIGGTAWTNISPPVDVPCGAIAVDGTTTPTTLYVGTDLGVIRSVDGGHSWSVLDDIHFPRVPVFDLAFNPTAGVLVAGTYGRGVFKFVTPKGPSIAVNLEDKLEFGSVCSGPVFLTLTVYNVGGANLVVTSVQWLMGSTYFTVLGTPATPLTILPGDSVEFTVQYQPTVSGTAEGATIRIISNDPTAPFVDVIATGEQGTGKVATAIADSGSFGNVCLGSFADELLTIDNAGTCPLVIFAIDSLSGEFLAPHVVSYPLVVSPGASLEVPIRFQPSGYGATAGTINIFSNDPASPSVVAVLGNAPAPTLNLILADTGNFGNVCVGRFADEPLVLSNSGKCTLTIEAITSDSIAFLASLVLSYPLNIAAGGSLAIPIRFQPTGFGPASATITVFSNDPASPATIAVSGNAPSGLLAVTGSTHFGGVTACCCADRTISICNVGDCKLNVTSVRFKRRSRHWRLIHNPFPAALHPGSCLAVVIQYRATEKCARCCELVIESDDPTTPVKIVEVLAYTVWNEGCREGCEECRKGGCEGCHKGGSCSQGYECCCEDDEEEDNPA
jgi:hypothetical protein